VEATRNPLTQEKGRCPLKHSYQASGHEFQPEVVEAANLEPLEEVLIPDTRAGLTPADMVERKFLHMMRGAAVAGSQVRMVASRLRGATPAANPLRN